MQTIASSFPFAPQSDPAFVRFLSRFDASGPCDSCWTWTHTKTTNGYGIISVNRTVWMTHRLSFLWANGYLTNGLQINHLCWNRACVNPKHLEEVTHAENQKKRAPKTHCLHGHLRTEENWYRSRSNPKGRCRICRRLQAACRKRNDTT